MAINKRKESSVKDEPQNAILASLGFDSDWKDFETPAKRSKQDERLVKNVGRVNEKIDSFEERLARINNENTFAQSFIDSLLNDVQNGEPSTVDNSMNQGKFYCNFCDISLPNGLGLCAHMLDRHVTSTKKLFFCPICSSSFKEPGHLQEHISDHCSKNACSLCNSCTNGKPKEIHPIEEVARLKLVCDYCSHTDTSISSLQVHCLVCTNNPSNENYQKSDEGRVCHTCLQVFNSNAQMLKHVAQKHNGKPNQDEIVKKFVCEDCGRRFISGTSLGGHKKIHTRKPGVLTQFVSVRPEDRLESKPAKHQKSSKLQNHSVKREERPVLTVPESNGPVEDMPDF